MTNVQQRFLITYSAILTAAAAFGVMTAASPNKKTSFDEISVQRVNVVEPDGTLRMVISDHARMPGVIVRGKQAAPPDRPQAGMLFFNDEGSEIGGLIFGGRRNAKGEIVDAGGSLSFDKYGANQVVQLIGVDDSSDRLAGLSVVDSITGTDNRRRIWVGRGDDGAARIVLSDGKGVKRIVMQVTDAGAASLSFFDENGALIQNLVPSK
jgi:hypothetical protein